MNYSSQWHEVVRTRVFDDWMRRLKDRQAAARIAVRIDRLAAGHFGDARPIGEGLSELRIDVGPGYRVYYLTEGGTVVVLLCGGDKSSQRRDIARAHELASEWRMHGRQDD